MFYSFTHKFVVISLHITVKNILMTMITDGLQKEAVGSLIGHDLITVRSDMLQEQASCDLFT